MQEYIFEEEVPYCCELMKTCIEDCRVMIGYDFAGRFFYIPFTWPHEKTQVLFYCPWCGVKFPKDLKQEWFQTLKDEYGIDDPFKRKYPPEFDTDEWWKKRGL